MAASASTSSSSSSSLSAAMKFKTLLSSQHMHALHRAAKRCTQRILNARRSRRPAHSSSL
eukprot:6462258-Lingulodinium_polyedra.AAC.1